MFWKKKIDDQEEAEKKEKEKNSNSYPPKPKYDQRLLDFQEKFKCHICNKYPQEPEDTGHEISIMGMPVWVGGVNLDSPDDHKQCKKCNKWTCKDHIYKGICQTCAEKMSGGVNQK